MRKANVYGWFRQALGGLEVLVMVIGSATVIEYGAVAVCGGVDESVARTTNV